MNGTTNITGKSDAEAVLEAAKKFGQSELISLGENGPGVLSVPDAHGGRSIKSIKPLLDEYAKAPDRKKGTAKLTSLDSFVAHVNRHKDGDSVIFAKDDKSEPALTAVYDYNLGGPTGTPRFGQHRAQYSFPVSEEWKAWLAASEKEMSQEAFAEFLEDRIGDVMRPEVGGDGIKEFAVNLNIDLATPMQLMGISRSLKIAVNQEVANAINLGSGEGQIVFKEEHKTEDGVTLRVPGGFAIAIPVFRLGAAYQIPVRLRYRHKSGKITWLVTPHRTDVTFAHAFDEAAKKAGEDTQVPVFYGSQEI